MTAVATALALAALLALGGDVIRGFVFAMLWGATGIGIARLSSQERERMLAEG